MAPFTSILPTRLTGSSRNDTICAASHDSMHFFQVTTPGLGETNVAARETDNLLLIIMGFEPHIS